MILLVASLMLTAFFGVAAWRVHDADGLRGALTEALAANAPAFIEVMSDIDKDYPPYEFHAPKRA